MSKLLTNFPEMDARESYEAMATSLRDLTAMLVAQDKDYPCWMATPDNPSGGRDDVLWLYNQLFYQKGQDKRATLYGPGFLGTSAAVIEKAQLVNTNKDWFKDTMQAIKKRDRLQVGKEIFEGHFERNPGQAETLRRSGIGTLHLKQSYRHIPVVEHTPKRIGFSWSKNSRSIEKMTYLEAEKALVRYLDEATAQRILDDIDENIFIARVRGHSPHVRANLVLPISNKHKQISASMPLLFPTEDFSVPLYKPVPHDPDNVQTQRLDRDDQRVDYENPLFLNDTGTIGLYPYLEK